MNLRHMEVFIAVVETGKVTSAAEKLFIAQPAISQTISEIEKEYNIKLFERLNRHLYLTKIGEIFYEKSKQILKSFQETREVLIDFNKIFSVKIGASVTVGSCVLPKILKNFSTDEIIQFENITVDNTEKILHKIILGELDFAIVEGESHNKNIVTEKLCDDKIVLCTINGEIKDNTINYFIVREEGSGTRSKSLQALKDKNIKINNLWEISNPQAALTLLESTDAFTGISKRFIENEVPYKFIECHINRSFYLVYHKDKKFDKRIEKLIEYVRNTIV